MIKALDDFCAAARSALAAADDHGGRQQVREHLEALLLDDEFRATHLPTDDDSGMTEIYRDPELGFCVLTYNMGAPRQSPPHDHGNSWAVYGQVVGHTDMTVWRQTGDGDGIEESDKFRLNPGQAGLFDVREIHSINYGAGAKFVRVTGVDMSDEPRKVFDAEAGTVRQIERVGTGNA